MKIIYIVVVLSSILFSTSCIFEEDVVEDYDPNNHTTGILIELESTFEFDSIRFKYVPQGEFAKTLIIEIADDFEKSSATGLTSEQHSLIGNKIFETFTKQEKNKFSKIDIWYTNEFNYDRFFSINEMKIFVYSYKVKDDRLIPSYQR